MGKHAAARPDVTLANLRRALHELRDSMLRLESEHCAALRGIASRHSAGARNLLHYLGMRRHDLRQTQTGLATLGLSSLGRAESAALFSVDAVLAVLDKLCAAPALPPADWPCDLHTGEELRAEITDAAMGHRAECVMLNKGRHQLAVASGRHATAAPTMVVHWTSVGVAALDQPFSHTTTPWSKEPF